jgi:hypothetical protein
MAIVLMRSNTIAIYEVDVPIFTAGPSRAGSILQESLQAGTKSFVVQLEGERL